MKKGYVLFVLVGVVIAMLWLNWGLFDHTQDNGLRENNNSEIMAKPTAYVITNKGEQINVEEMSGIVKNWDYKNGNLSFQEDKFGEKIIEIDPSRMVLMINSLKVKGRDLMVTEKSGYRWEQAFCKGDMVVIRVDEKNQPVFVINNGYRSCGFKGE